MEAQTTVVSEASVIWPPIGIKTMIMEKILKKIYIMKRGKQTGEEEKSYQMRSSLKRGKSGIKVYYERQ